MTWTLDNAFHLGVQKISDIKDEGVENQSLQRKNATEGFQNGLDWIHFTGGGK